MSTIHSQHTPNRISRRAVRLVVAAAAVLAGALAVSLSAAGPAPTEPAVVLSEATTPSADAAGSCHLPDAIAIAEGVTVDALCNPPASTTTPAADADEIAPDPAFPDLRMR